MHPINFLIDTVMVPLITFFHATLPYHNYGLAVICLTLTVKLVLFPLTQKQFSSMRIMQRIQPRMKELQEKHRDDPQQMQVRMMELYKEAGTNPMAGCLPMLIQLPILFALYGSLNAPALVNAIKAAPPSEKGFLFVQDLLNHGVGAHGAWHFDNLALIVLFTVFSYITQRMMTTNPDDPMQRQMLFMAPLMGPMIGWAMPSGVLLYIVANSVFTIVQYLYLLRRYPSETAPAGTVAAGAAGGSVVEVQHRPAGGQDGAGDPAAQGRDEGRRKKR